LVYCDSTGMLRIAFLWVTFQDLRKIGGAGLLEQYQYSPFQMLSKLYPDYSWDIFRFDRITDSWEGLFQGND
jgi:hypothetical protein